MKIKYLFLSSFFVFMSCGIFDSSGGGENGAQPGPSVIANWDIVPNQVIPFSVTGLPDTPSSFKAGVVAFHEAGVDVEFRINGVSAQRIESPEYNDRTDVWEYFITINPSNYADGPIILSATAYTDSGDYKPKKLEDITLYMNSGGTYNIGSKIKYADAVSGDDATGDGSSGNPYKTLEKAYNEVGSGGIVYLEAGIYSAQSELENMNYDMWTTVTRSPSTTDLSDVIITSGNFRENNIHWHEVTLQRNDTEDYSTALVFLEDQNIWISSVDIDGQNRTQSGDSFNVQKSNIYLTDSTIHDINNAFSTTHFARNIDVTSVGADVIRAATDQLFVNITVQDINKTTTEAHCDIIQFQTPGDYTDNVILYNFKATAMASQGIFGTDDTQYASNLAFVNIIFDQVEGDTGHFSQVKNMEHVLIWHLTSDEAGFSVRVPDSVSTFIVHNNIFYTFSAQEETSLEGSAVSNNHFTSSNPFGTDYTTGDPNYNTSLIPQNSIQSSISLECVPADINGNKRTGSSIGAINY